MLGYTYAASLVGVFHLVGCCFDVSDTRTISIFTVTDISLSSNLTKFNLFIVILQYVFRQHNNIRN